MKKFKGGKKFDKIKLLKKRNQELRTDNDRMNSKITVIHQHVDKIINELEIVRHL